MTKKEYIKAQLNIALFWYETILYSNDPSLVWEDVKRLM